MGARLCWHNLYSMQIVVPDDYKRLYVVDESRPILKIPDPRLRQKAAEILKVTKKTAMLVDDMIRIMKRANGIGLAAPQLGILHRLVVMAPDNMRPTPLINPKILKSEGEQIGQEGCLSIPGLYGDVKRAQLVEVEALDKKGRLVTYEFEGMPARVVQHEIDHLDGVLFIDKVIQETLHWMNPEGEPAE
jgi:peptide deformylase